MFDYTYNHHIAGREIGSWIMESLDKIDVEKALYKIDYLFDKYDTAIDGMTTVQSILESDKE